MNDSKDNSLCVKNGLKNRKDTILHLRFEDTISRCGISKREFYSRSGLSPAYYWRLSWGIDRIPSWLKTKLCSEFGKPFIDFFLMTESEVEKNG